VFDGSVLENVKMGLQGTPSATLPEPMQIKLVEEACKSAFAHEFIQRLPEVSDFNLTSKRPGCE
jgi:ATP-binding cassette, subfamily B (MDR/TAP), member 1